LVEKDNPGGPRLIVVDANVLAYSIIEGALTPLALQVRKRDPHWRLPGIWRHEILNIFTTYVRQGGLSKESAAKALDDVYAHILPYEVELGPVETLDVAIHHKISAYDAQYVLLAQKLGVPCVTEDRSLRQAAPRWTVSMEGFINPK
jgi:predicted nucleic acid-binding protein